jgi:hypothetical protein
LKKNRRPYNWQVQVLFFKHPKVQGGVQGAQFG